MLLIFLRSSFEGRKSYGHNHTVSTPQAQHKQHKHVFTYTLELAKFPYPSVFIWLIIKTIKKFIDHTILVMYYNPSSMSILGFEALEARLFV